MIHWRVKGLSCETNNQPNVLYHFKKLRVGLALYNMLKPPVIHYLPFQGGSFVVVICVRVSVTFHLTCVNIILLGYGLLIGLLFGHSCSCFLCNLTICYFSYFPFWF